MLVTPQSPAHRSYSSAEFSQMPLPHVGEAGAQSTVKLPVTLGPATNSIMTMPLLDATVP